MALSFNGHIGELERGLLFITHQPSLGVGDRAHCLVPSAHPDFKLPSRGPADTRHPLHSPNFFPILHFFSTIETLNYSCGFDKRPSFLTMEDPALLEYDGTLLPALDIQSLRFCSSPIAPPLMQALRQTSSARSLRSVEVCAQDRETLVALGELLRDVRLYISELTVDCRRRNALHILKDGRSASY